MSKKSSSKTNFLAQGTILVIASFVAKAIGMIYRIPLTHILGDDGNGYYSTANEIYTIILMISSFSLPLAVSRLVAEREYAGEVKNSYKVLICSLRFAAVTGGILSILTFLLGGVITKYVMGVEIINAIVSVAGAYVMLQYGLKLGEKKGDAELGTALAAAGGTFGTVASVGVALLFMIVIYLGYRNGFKRRMKKDKTRRRESDRAIYRAITYTILPIVLSTLVYNISTIIDQGVFNHILAGMGFTQKQYATVWGIYSGKFRVLMNVPLSIASCLAPSVVPALTEAMANNDLREAGLRTRDTIRYTMVFTIPCAVGMAALARPIMMMLYGNNDSLALAAGIMQSGALLTVLLALSTLTTGILQGLGEMQAPLVHAATAVAIHLGFLVLFVVKFKWNIYGVVYANIIFGLIICLLNARSIRKKLHYRQEIKKTFLVPVIAAGVMGIAAYLVHRVFNLFAGNTISTILAVCVGAVVYGICLVKLGGILEREIRRLPKGDLLADLLIRLNIL